MKKKIKNEAARFQMRIEINKKKKVCGDALF